MPHSSLLPAPRLTTPADVRQSDAELLQRHGIKPTAKRLLVYEALCASTPGDQLTTPDGLYMTIRRTGETVQLTSIYNVLGMMADADLIERYRLGEGQALYRPHRGARLAALLVCGDCGQVHGVRETALESRIQQLASAQQFVLTETTVVLRGHCTRCAGSTRGADSARGTDASTGMEGLDDIGRRTAGRLS